MTRDQVLADQRRRLIEAVPDVVGEHGYGEMTVADLVRAAGVSRNAFYDNFADKHDCFAAAFEACHELLIGVVTRACRPEAPLEERVGVALGAALDLLSEEPGVARLLFVESLASGSEIGLRQHEWLRRYGSLLRDATPRLASRPGAAGELDTIVAGGIASRLGGEILQGGGSQLRLLIPSLARYLLAFYASEEGSGGEVPGRVQPPEPAAQPEAQRSERERTGA